MRNFPDFIKAYEEYAQDYFCPPQFHTWTGLSILAGALERKVWVKQGLITQYPNIYTLLVSHPSMGKSTALERGVDLIEELKKVHNKEIKIIPTQATEPALIDLMRIVNSLSIGSTIVQYSSGYFYASEASSSALQNICGDFNAAITGFYDCPKMFRKKLKGENHTTEIPNACFNVLAGTTFDFLKRLVNDESVLGGLASRFIYVIHKDRFVRESKWQTEQKRDDRRRSLLIEDLAEINKIVGPFKASPGFIDLWEKWQPTFDQSLIDLKSPRLESILARKSTNLMKICMLLSISENNERELHERHWERGLKLIEEVTKDNAFVLSSAIMAKSDTQAGLNQFILETIKNGGGVIKMSDLRKGVNKQNSDASKFEPTINSMSQAGQVELVVIKGISCIKLLVDPNTNL